MKRARQKNKKAVRYTEQPISKQREFTAAEENDIYSDIVRSVNAKYNTNDAKVQAKPKKKRRPFRTFFIILCLLAAALAVFMGFGSYFDASIKDGKINVLVMGVDEDGMRTDSIMLASYDIKESTVNMISIPRDTKIYVENRKVTRKVNEIHAMSSKKKKGEILGAKATVEAVTQLTGIPVDYYVEFSFSAIDHLFDILGPVEFDVPDVEGKGRGMNYDDPVQNLHIHLKPGLQKLSGNQVQQFLRYRKSNSGRSSGSDIDRVARQQDFVKAVVEQKMNPSILVKLPSIYAQLSREIKTNISASDITKYVKYLSRLTGESMQSHSLPGEAKTISGGSYFVCDLGETEELVATFGYTEVEAKDKITLTENYSQKPLKAGNKGKDSKKTAQPEKNDEKDDDKAKDKNDKSDAESTKAPTKAPTKTPTKAPTKEPTKAPAVTKPPATAPAVTKPPLEDMEMESDE